MGYCVIVSPEHLETTKKNYSNCFEIGKIISLHKNNISDKIIFQKDKLTFLFNSN